MFQMFEPRRPSSRHSTIQSRESDEMLLTRWAALHVSRGGTVHCRLVQSNDFGTLLQTMQASGSVGKRRPCLRA